jgi:hypothetical protein
MSTPESDSQPRQSPPGDPFLTGDISPSRSRPPSPRPSTRSTARARVLPDYLQAVRWLQARDQVLIDLLDEHRTLTTTQISSVLFSAPGTGRHRLYTLRRAGWIDSFTPIRAAGPLETHWVLGPYGVRWAAYEAQRPVPSPKTQREQREAIAASAHLQHDDGARQFFINLLTLARTTPDTRLVRWWSPARSAAALGQRAHPDGHGVWEENGHQVGFWLEYDTGTEKHAHLQDKIERHRRLHLNGAAAYPLLFWLPNRTREATFHRRLNGQATRLDFTVASATPDAGDNADAPAGPIWKIAGNGRRRHRLSDLPADDGPAGPYRPGPPLPEQNPLWRMLGPADAGD